MPRGTSLKWTGDVAVFTVKAPFADVRQAKIDKKKADEQPKDSLARLDLRTLEWKMIGASGATAMGSDAAPYLFAAQDVKGRKSKNLLRITVATGAVDTLKNVSAFETSAAGDRLLVTTAKEEKDSLSRSAVILYDLAKGSIDTLSSGRKAYAGGRFSAAGDKVLFAATDEEEKTDGTPAYALLFAQERVLQKATRRTPAVTEWTCCELLPADAAALPEGWIVGSGAGAAFSNADSRVILRLQEKFPP